MKGQCTGIWGARVGMCDIANYNKAMSGYPLIDGFSEHLLGNEKHVVLRGVLLALKYTCPRHLDTM